MSGPGLKAYTYRSFPGDQTRDLVSSGHQISDHLTVVCQIISNGQQPNRDYGIRRPADKNTFATFPPQSCSVLLLKCVNLDVWVLCQLNVKYFKCFKEHGIGKRLVSPSCMEITSEACVG